MDMTYHEEFHDSLKEAVMLLHMYHPVKHGHATDGDLPDCKDLVGLLSNLQHSIVPVMLGYMSQGETVEVASEYATLSALNSAMEIGFATGRVFQAHGYNVPRKKEQAS